MVLPPGHQGVATSEGLAAVKHDVFLEGGPHDGKEFEVTGYLGDVVTVGADLYYRTNRHFDGAPIYEWSGV